MPSICQVLPSAPNRNKNPYAIDDTIDTIIISREKVRLPMKAKKTIVDVIKN